MNSGYMGLYKDLMGYVGLCRGDMGVEGFFGLPLPELSLQDWFYGQRQQNH